MKIPLQIARRMALNAQLLDAKTELPEGKEGVAQTIEKLGYVQIDTIAAIQRAHHHTLWTRRPDYTPEMIHELQAKDRRVFEYWGHSLSYLPMADYRFYLPHMRGLHDPYGKWEKQRQEKFGPFTKPIRERIREEGPLSHNDFNQPAGEKASRGPDPRAAKVALELLFWRGELMITERRNFQRVYDLAERVLPDDVETAVPDDDELGQFLVRRALSAYGVAREGEIREHIYAAEKGVISKALYDLVDTGEVIKVKVEKKEGIDYFALSSMISASSGLKRTAPRLHIISPFDNLIVQRERIKSIFDFDYALECYVAPAKRKYGYFVLPILWGERFVGRLDPKADRKKKTFIVNNLVFEPCFKADDKFIFSFIRKLWDLARFNHCEKITIKKTSPASIKATLERELKKMS